MRGIVGAVACWAELGSGAEARSVQPRDVRATPVGSAGTSTMKGLSVTGAGWRRVVSGAEHGYPPGRGPARGAGLSGDVCAALSCYAMRDMAGVVG